MRSLFVEGLTRELSLKRILVGGQPRDKLGSSMLTVYRQGDLHANHPFFAGYDDANPSVSGKFKRSGNQREGGGRGGIDVQVGCCAAGQRLAWLCACIWWH